jgi:hypothetical protein
MTWLTLWQLKAERLQRMRADPFYIGVNDRPNPPMVNGHDVDAIPVVRLDDLPMPSHDEGKTCGGIT